mgnify:CR=1 FL=1
MVIKEVTRKHSVARLHLVPLLRETVPLKTQFYSGTGTNGCLPTPSSYINFVPRYTEATVSTLAFPAFWAKRRIGFRTNKSSKKRDCAKIEAITLMK